MSDTIAQPSGPRPPSGALFGPVALNYWFAFLGTAVALSALYWFDPSWYHFYPLCLFHHLTGLLCPGCGSLRALHQLLHGHVAAAFRFNAWFMICLPFMIWCGVRAVLRTPTWRPDRRFIGSALFWVMLSLTVLFGILRNLPGSPFSLLRP